MLSRYVASVKGVLLMSFTEIESGKSDTNRPQLQAALAACKKHKAILLIAKLDRLSRSVAFTAALLESPVKFVACDMPNADRTFLQMVAVFAEYEREQISKRTKAALAAAKARGQKLGNPTLIPAINEPRIAQANEFAQNPQATLEGYLARGMTQEQIAKVLARAKVPTAKGGQWSARQVRRVLARLTSQENPE